MTAGNVGRTLRYEERCKLEPEFAERIRERCKIYARKQRKKERAGIKPKPKIKIPKWHKSWHVTDDDVKRNLDKVEQGQDLDMPLAVLDGTFKHIYEKETEKKCRSEIQKSGRYKEHLKEWKKEYFSRPGVKRRLKLSMKKYNSRPEVKVKRIEYSRKHYIAMSALIEMYRKEFQEINNTMKYMTWNKRRSKVCTILRNRHRDEFRDLFKIAKPNK